MVAPLPTITSSTSAVTSPAAAGLRLHQRQAFSIGPTGRARIWPSMVMVISPASRLAKPKSITTGAPSGRHDVRRLDVAMHHALLVGIVQGLRHVGDQLGGLARRGPSRGEEIGERHAVDEI